MFLTDERHKEFFARLEDLVAQYDELALPSIDLCEDPDFDPAAPKMIDGMVVVICYKNIQGFEELMTIAPLHQNSYLTIGLLSEASVMNQFED